jgi:SMI1 / KNR4 family (SUKH-1)
MQENIKFDYELTEGQLNEPASEQIVAALVARNGGDLPMAYRDFLLEHNGGEGFVGARYIILWRAEEIHDFNTEYEVDTYAPGILLFASSGGGEGYGFDTREPSWPIVRIPFIGMSLNDVELVASNFSSLFQALRETGYEE